MRWWPRATSLVVIGLTLAWTGFIVRPHVAGLSSPLDRFEEVCLDLRYLISPLRPPPPTVVLVAIDDETVRQAGTFPLPRSTLASIIEAIARQKPRAIAVDLLLIAAGPADADARLSDALRSSPAVIAAAGLFSTTDPAGRVSVPAAASLLWPTEPMASAADIGLVNLSTGFGGIPRHVPLIFEGPDGVVPSFVLATVALASGETPRVAPDRVRFGDRAVPLDLGQHLVIRFYGPKGTIPTVSAATLLGPDRPTLADRVVVIGATAAGSGDTFPSPFSNVVSGAEVLATAIDNLLDGDALVRTRLTRWLDAAAAFALALTAVALIATRRSLLGLVLVLLLAGTWAAVTLVAFAQGYWLSTSVPIAAMIPVAACTGSLRLWQERRRSGRLAGIEKGLRPFHPRPMSDRLGRDPSFLSQPLVQDAAVLFVDLSGYTTLSETHDPVRMRDLLKSFHALIDEVVDAHGGFVVTFMGDGAMIVFGFPQPRPDDAARALAALLELDAQLRVWGSADATDLAAPIRSRLGAHFGSVVFSRLDGESHQQITATGDTVNVASRLLEVAKERNVPVVMSEDLAKAAGQEASMARFSATIAVPIRGRRQSVRVRLASRTG